MTNPRVLIVGNFLSAHGASRGVCEELAPRLKNSGWTILTTSSQRSKAIRLADMLLTIWSRRNDYEVAQVDVYSGPAFFWAEAACWLLRRLDRPYILTLHGGGLPEFGRASKARVTKLLKSAYSVTVPSPYLLHQMAEFRQDLVLLPNGLEVGAYRTQLPRPVHPRLFWLRAFHQVYNPGMAIRVLSRLKTEFPSIRLTMIGPDKGDLSLEETTRLMKELKVESQVEIRGPVPKGNVPAVLRDGDVFLNTTSVDNTPVTVLEAMASGLCVVSTNVGGIPYLLKDKEEALLVPANDDAAMASAVRRVLTDSVLAGNLQMAAAAKVSGFDWNELIPAWKKLFIDATSAHPVQNCSPAYSDL